MIRWKDGHAFVDEVAVLVCGVSERGHHEAPVLLVPCWGGRLHGAAVDGPEVTELSHLLHMQTQRMQNRTVELDVREVLLQHTTQHTQTRDTRREVREPRGEVQAVVLEEEEELSDASG